LKTTTYFTKDFQGKKKKKVTVVMGDWFIPNLY